MNNRPQIRLFREKNCNKFTEIMALTDWESFYLTEILAMAAPHEVCCDGVSGF